ncbi:MAG TPA: hypothetical protein PKA77_18345, partial [Chitinophagaceae bacterium]|nr:hypothetical protein [Chitinophagaceae bacterium]
ALGQQQSALNNVLSKSPEALKKLGASSNQSTNALMNLSRVAQDAPYGFIGIANNINPLLESFQRLKASTGTTGSALKELGKGLMGPAGLGLAVGVISSLMVTFGDRLFGAGKKAKETAEEIDRVRKVLAETARTADDVKITAFGDTEAESQKVQVLAGIIKDQTRSYNERNQALKELKSINKNYFEDISLESTGLATLTNRVNEYTDAIIAAQVTKILADDIGKVSVEISKALNQYNKLGKEFDAANAKAEKLKKQTDVDIRGRENITYGALYKDAADKAKDFNKQLSAQGVLLGDLNTRKLELRNLLTTAISESLKFRPLKVDGLSVKPNDVKIEMPPGKLWQFEMEVSEFNFAPKTLKVSKPVVITPVIDTKGLDKLVHSPALSKLKEITDANSAKAWKELNEQWEYTANVLASSITPAFMEFIDAIGKGQNAFQAFGQMIKQVLADVIKRLIETAIFASILSLVSGGNVKFGQAFTQLLGLGKRASGGPVSAGRPYIVGEVGRELFVPSTSGRIVPNNDLGSIIGGAMQLVNVTVNGRISGRDLVLVQARESRYQTNNV